MNNILESVFKELVKRNIIITEAEGEEETVTSTSQAAGARTTLKLPKFKVNEKSWGTKVSSEDRSFVELLGNKLAGKTPLERVTLAQKFLDEHDEMKQNITVGEVMANLMFLDIFASIVMDFNESVAGFLFEALFAGIFEGFQISAKEGGGEAGTTDIVINTKFGNQDYSLKLLTKGGVVIKGSVKDILSGIEASPDKKEVYLVGLKTKSSNAMTIDFYEFDVGLDNWFDWIGRPTFKDKIVEVPFKYLGSGQIEAEDQFKDMISSILQKGMGKQETGTFDDKLQFTKAAPSEGEKTVERVFLKSPLAKYQIKHNIGGQLEDTQFLIQDQDYRISVIHPTEKQVSFEDSKTEGAFVDLYGTLLKNFKSPSGEGFLDYIQTGEYKKDPAAFFEMLKQIPQFKKGGQFIITQPYLMEMVNRGQARGPATITLDRQKFLRAADNYAEKVGSQIYELYTNLANLIDDVSGYFLGGTVAERNSYGRKARQEAQVVFEAAEKNLVELQEDDTEKAQRASATQRAARKGQSQIGTMSDIRESKEDLNDFSKSLLENLIKK